MLSNYTEPWTTHIWVIYLLVLCFYFGIMYVLNAVERINYGDNNNDDN